MKNPIVSGLFCLALVLPAQGGVIVTNLTGGGPYTNGTVIGNGALDPASRDYQAFGITVGATALQFVSLETIFDNDAFLFSRDIGGGIYSDNGGNPGTELAAFNEITLPVQAQNVLLTSTTTLQLAANTTYWFVLTGPVGIGLLPNWQRDEANTAPVGFGAATPVGYRFSANNQASWQNSTVNNQLQINATEDFEITLTPEPSSFILAASGLLLALRLRRR